MLDDLLRQFSGGTDFRKFGAVVDAVWEQRDSLGDAIEFFAANRDQMTKALGFVHEHGDEVIDLLRAVPDILGQAGTGIEAAGNAACTASRFLSGDGDRLTADRALATASVTLDKCQGLVGEVARLVAAIGDRFSGIPFVGEATEVLRQGGQCVDDVAQQLGDASSMFGRLGEQLAEAGGDLNRAGQQLASSGAALRLFGAAAGKPATPEQPWALVAAAADVSETPPVVTDLAPREVSEPAPQAPARKSPAKKAPAKRTTAKKTAARKTPAKKTPVKRTTAKKTAARKTPAKKTPAKRTTAKKTAARKTPAKKTPAKRTTAKKTAARKTPAKKAPAKRTR